MTKGQLRASFSVYAQEIGRCKKGGCYWSLLHLVMSLPDVCNTLEVEPRDDKQKNVGERYKEWCRKYLATADFDEQEWWDARNTILHQGTTPTRTSTRYAGFVFSPPGGPGHRLVDLASNKLRLDVWSLADQMVAAMELWFDALLADPNRLQVVEKYLPELVWADPSDSPQGYRSTAAPQ